MLKVAQNQPHRPAMHSTHWSNHRLYVSLLHTGDMYSTGNAIYMGSLKCALLLTTLTPLSVDVVISRSGSTRDVG